MPWWLKHSLFGASLIAVDKESTCNAGDPSLIPGLGRSTGGEISYPLQYSWASQVAQLVKNPPVIRETWVWSLGWEDPLEEGLATHSSILAWRISWTEEPSRLQSTGSQTVGHGWATFTFTFFHGAVCTEDVCNNIFQKMRAHTHTLKAILWILPWVKMCLSEISFMLR